MKIIEKKPDKIVFTAEINESLANAMRRSINEIPILAIDEVEIHKNDSALYDEIIAHRIGLIPLKTDKIFVEFDECTCKGKGCTKCTAELKLKVKGPCTVYAKELKGKVNPVFENMPITILEKGQEVELIGFARIGKGVNHPKFTPGILYYRNIPKIEFSKECRGEKMQKYIDACPKKIIISEGGKPVVKETYKCDLCEACIEVGKKENEEVKIHLTNEIIFFIESWGQLEPKKMLIEAVKALKKNLKDLEKKLK